MAYARSPLYDGDAVARAGDVAAASVAQRKLVSAVDAEIDTLRSINAHLVRQVALLKQREAQAQQLADRDGLTGLFNRRRLSQSLNAAIADASRARHRIGLLFIDLDGFKGINDSYGHAMGDELLVRVAARIATRARAADSICRYGGDEFVAVLPGIPNRAAAIEVASMIGERLALPYLIAGKKLQVTAAIGVSVYPEDGQEAAVLLRRADERMYRAKAVARQRASDQVPHSTPVRRRDDQRRDA